MSRQNDGRFAKLFNYCPDYPFPEYSIHVDKTTGVQYLVVEERKGGGGITVLLGKDGKPLLYKPDEESA